MRGASEDEEKDLTDTAASVPTRMKTPHLHQNRTNKQPQQQATASTSNRSNKQPQQHATAQETTATSSHSSKQPHTTPTATPTPTPTPRMKTPHLHQNPQQQTRSTKPTSNHSNKQRQNIPTGMSGLILPLIHVKSITQRLLADTHVTLHTWYRLIFETHHAISIGDPA
jgi:hypothetical protein